MYQSNTATYASLVSGVETRTVTGGGHRTAYTRKCRMNYVTENGGR
jgi:hypothetical protein